MSFGFLFTFITISLVLDSSPYAAFEISLMSQREDDETEEEQGDET